VTFRVEQRGSIQVIWLDRPERGNAMVPELMDGLTEHLRHLSAAPPGAVVLTGAGSHFCVGADLKWLDSCSDPANGVAVLVAAFHAAIAAIRDTPAPVIAAVNGATAGGGLGLALAPDVRVASTRATFTAAYARLGLPPDGGSSAFLVRTMGVGRATEFLLSNRTLDARQALEWGLVNEVVPADAVVDRACEVAQTFVGIPAETLLTTRRLLDAAAVLPLETVLQREALAVRTAARRPMFRQRLNEFVRGRGPRGIGNQDSGFRAGSSGEP
jgi:2-(1,2-epoxy-1,2-dihydrophenyl)acetyl-CoA isomerase